MNGRGELFKGQGQGSMNNSQQSTANCQPIGKHLIPQVKSQPPIEDCGLFPADFNYTFTDQSFS
jgi:hypothetical protein